MNKNQLFRSQIYLSAVLDHLCHNQEAQRLLEESIHQELEEKELWAFALRTMGKIYAQSCQYSRAQDLFEKSMKIYQNIPHPIKTDFYNSAILLIENYMYSGQYEKAKILLNNNETMNDNHSALSNALRLARLHMLTGHYKQAQELLQKNLKIIKPNMHHKVGRYTTYLADTYRSLGLFEKSKQMIQNSLAIYKKIYGSEHVLWVNGYFGYLLCDMGDYVTASQLLEQSVQKHKELYGTNNRRYIFFLCGLAHVYTNLNKWDEAEILFKEGLNYLKCQFLERHVEYALIIKN